MLLWLLCSISEEEHIARNVWRTQTSDLISVLVGTWALTFQFKFFFLKQVRMLADTTGAFTEVSAFCYFTLCNPWVPEVTCLRWSSKKASQIFHIYSQVSDQELVHWYIRSDKCTDASEVIFIQFRCVGGKRCPRKAVSSSSASSFLLFIYWKWHCDMSNFRTYTHPMCVEGNYWIVIDKIFAGSASSVNYWNGLKHEEPEEGHVRSSPHHPSTLPQYSLRALHFRSSPNHPSTLP